MEEQNFNPEDIGNVPWQYAINIRKATDFKYGDEVFLKSNPEVKMRVSRIFKIKNLVRVRWADETDVVQSAMLPPECLLKYSYAGLVVYKDWPNVLSLN